MTSDQHKWLNTVSAIIGIAVFITGITSFPKLQESIKKKQHSRKITSPLVKEKELVTPLPPRASYLTLPREISQEDLDELAKVVDEIRKKPSVLVSIASEQPVEVNGQSGLKISGTLNTTKLKSSYLAIVAFVYYS